MATDCRPDIPRSRHEGRPEPGIAGGRERKGTEMADHSPIERVGTQPVCVRCGSPRRQRFRNGIKTGWDGGRGLCAACYKKAWRRGFPAEWGVVPALSRSAGDAQGRREDYAELRSWGETRERAAARLGVSIWTTYLYERRERMAG